MTGAHTAPIGIFGGTFDPIHFGHLRPALELKEQLSFSRMLLIPASVPPHREQPVASVEQRLRMLELAIADEPSLELDQRELNRSGPSFMVDTLASLREESGETPLCLCLGIDAFLGLPGWHQWESLLELAHIVVAHRPGWTLDAQVMPASLQDLMDKHWQEDTAALGERPAGSIVLQAVTQLDISATGIRHCISTGRSARYLVPNAVWHYILDNRLYR